MDDRAEGAERDAFLAAVSPRLLEALVGALGQQLGHEAHALAMVYAWEHATRVMAMESPVGYLYRVGRSGVRERRRPGPALYVGPTSQEMPEFEPRLLDALGALPEKQRHAVFLVVGCGWSYAEFGRVTERSEATVRGLVDRGLRRLRRDLRVENDR